MKKIVAVLAFGVAMMSGAAFADTIQNGYGNTFVVTNAAGQESRYQFNEDGTFTGTAPGGSAMAGTYSVTDGQLCMNPPNGGAPLCTAVAVDKNVGDSWTQTGTDGSQITVSLVAGH